jgi:hypothetical protein
MNSNIDDCSAVDCDGRFHRSFGDDGNGLTLCRVAYPRRRPFPCEGLTYDSDAYREEYAKLRNCERCNERKVERSQWSMCYACGIAIEMERATDPDEVMLLALEVLRLTLPARHRLPLPLP